MTTVLIAEDDLMIADFLEDILVDAGYTVCGIAITVAQAVELGNAFRPDLAILDLRLKDGGLGTEIAPLLTERDRIGILYATGNDYIALTQVDGHVCIRKPYVSRELLQALWSVEMILAGCAVPSSVPDNARILA